MIDAVLFDLDGTLWDACESMTVSWNRTLAARGRAPLTVDAMRGAMGCTAEEFARRLFADLPLEEGLKLFNTCVQEECAYLREHGGILFPGVRDTLELLSRDRALIIISNCQEGYIEAFLEHHDLAKYFIDSDCYGHTGLPKGETMRQMLQCYRFKAPVYVGDTCWDAEAAAQAEIPFIFARYGFGEATTYDAVIDRFDQLPATLAALADRETE